MNFKWKNKIYLWFIFMILFPLVNFGMDNKEIKLEDFRFYKKIEFSNNLYQRNLVNNKNTLYYFELDNDVKKHSYKGFGDLRIYDKKRKKEILSIWRK